MSVKITGHIVSRFDSEMLQVHSMLLAMGQLAIDQLQATLDALEHLDLEKARQIVACDAKIDQLEMKIDDEVVKVIARRGPVARDLRALMAMSKSVTDLERVGDEIAKVARHFLRLYDTYSTTPRPSLMFEIQKMGKTAMEMLKTILQVFEVMDADKAKAVVKGHTEMDEEFKAGLRRLMTFVMEDSRNVGHTVSIVLIIKALERIGDHAKNIAEQVIYFVEGEDVRHQYPQAKEG